jgi:hypothetical protein
MHVLLLLVAAPTCSSTPISTSSEFWDTLPMGIHGGIAHRLSGDIIALAKFSVVAVDPIEGPVTTPPIHVVVLKLEEGARSRGGRCCRIFMRGYIDDVTFRRPPCTSPYHADCSANASACAVENNLVRTLKSVKAIDSTVITMVYLNSILMMPYFRLSQKMYANASALLLRDSAGKLMSFAGDGGSGFFCENFPTYDLTQAAAGAAILADFAEMQASGVVDGVYLDKSATWPGFGDNVAQGKDTICQHDCYTMTPAQTAAYIAGRLELFRGFDKACGLSGLCSIDYRVAIPPPLGAAAITDSYIPRSMHIFRHDAVQGLEVFPNETITFVRSMEGQTQRLLWYGTCQTQDQVAFFLVMAWEGCYCMTFSNDDTAAQLWTAGYHYGTKLGAPNGAATLVNDKTWIRSFAGGAKARYDLNTNVGKVIWPAHDVATGSDGKIIRF